MSDGTSVITPQQFQADILEAANKAQWAYECSTAAASSAAQAYNSAQSAGQSAVTVTALEVQSQANAAQAQYWAGLAQAINALTAQFDVADKNAGIELTNNNLTATFPGGQAALLGNVGHGAGQHYFEITFSQGPASSNASIGIATQKEGLSAQIGYDDATGAIGLFQSSGNIYQNGSRVAGSSSFTTVGSVVGVAVDAEKDLVWFRVGSGLWNGNSANDPVAGVGGVAYSLAGAVFPAVCTDANAQFTANFTGPFAATLPTGYRPWSADAYQYVVPLATKDTPGIAAFGAGMTIDAQGNVTSNQYDDLTLVQSWTSATPIDLTSPTQVYRLVLQTPSTAVSFENLTLPSGKSLCFRLYVEQGSGSNQVTQWDSRISWAGGMPPVLGYLSGTRNVLEFETIDGQTFYGYIVTQFGT